jgi:hypothetical protein
MWASINDQLVEMAAFFRELALAAKRFVWRQKWAVLLWGFGGAGIGFYGYLHTDVRYTERMTLSYVHLEKKIYGDMLADLSRTIQYGRLAEVDGFDALDKSDVEALLDVRGLTIKGEPLSGDLAADKVPFYVEVDVADPNALVEIESALLAYLDSPDFVRERLEFNRKRVEAKVVELERDLNQLEKERTDAAEASVQAALFEEVRTLRSQLEEAKGSLHFNRNIEVLDGLEPLSVWAEGPDLSKVFKGFLDGALIALAIGGIRMR